MTATLTSTLDDASAWHAIVVVLTAVWWGLPCRTSALGAEVWLLMPDGSYRYWVAKVR